MVAVPRPRLRRGIYLPPFGPFGEPPVLVDLAVRAEAAGWDGVFLWDHVVTGDASPVADCWTSFGRHGDRDGEDPPRVDGHPAATTAPLDRRPSGVDCEPALERSPHRRGRTRLR